MTYVLDTHVWVWWHMVPGRLSRRIHRRIAGAAQDGTLVLSAISPWEFCKLVEKGRLGIEGTAEAWMASALRMPGLQLAPLTPKIAYESTVLPAPFHNDPADQIIVATARERGATVLTADKRIRGYDHVLSDG